jgi:hypothetical protein
VEINLNAKEQNVYSLKFQESQQKIGIEGESKFSCNHIKIKQDRQCTYKHSGELAVEKQ